MIGKVIFRGGALFVPYATHYAYMTVFSCKSLSSLLFSKRNVAVNLALSVIRYPLSVIRYPLSVLLSDFRSALTLRQIQNTTKASLIFPPTFFASSEACLC